MKTIASRKALLNALDLIGLVVNKTRRRTLPILECFRLIAKGNSVRLFATNLDQTIEVQIDGEGQLDTVLNWKSIRDFLNKSKDEVVSLALAPSSKDKKSGSIAMACGSQTMNALFLKPEDMPDPTVLKDPITFFLAGKHLEEALRLTAYAQSTDASRYVLNGICFEHLTSQIAREEPLSEKEAAFLDPTICKATRTIPARAQSTTFIATDGRRMASYRIDMEADAPAKDVLAIVPTPAVNILLKLSKRFPEKVKVDFQPERIERPKGAKNDVTYPAILRMDFPQGTLTTKLIDGNYPNYRQVIPREHNFSLSHNRVHLIDAITSTQIKGHSTGGMKFTFDNHVLTLEQNDPDNCKSTGITSFYGALHRPFHISFNSDFVVDALKSLSSERIFLNFVDELTPMTITSPDDGHHTIVIMPMRTS